MKNIKIIEIVFSIICIAICSTTLLLSDKNEFLVALALNAVTFSVFVAAINVVAYRQVTDTTSVVLFYGVFVVVMSAVAFVLLLQKNSMLFALPMTGALAASACAILTSQELAIESNKRKLA